MTPSRRPATTLPINNENKAMMYAGLQHFYKRHERLPEPRRVKGVVSCVAHDCGRREVHGTSEGWVSHWGYLFTFANGHSYTTTWPDPELRAWLERNPVKLPA